MKLNLGASSKPPERSYHEEASDHAVLALTIALPSKNISLSASAGETVAMIKKRISDAENLSYASLELSFEGNKLIDPLSLNDVKQLRGKSSVTLVCQVKNA